MSLILSGSDGLSDVDGSAATPAIRGTDANTGIFFPAADTIAFAEGGVESARLNADSQFVAAAGTASLPVLTTTGDLNTGVYFPGADRIGFATNGTQRGEFDASGNFQFNSGYGSVATAYGCRAWVNFQGDANTNLSGTYSQSGTTVTVTATAHGLIVGSSINADITTGTGVDGIYTVATVTDANTFTYTAGTSLTTSGNVTLLRNTIRASGNVSSITDNGTGDYTVNFTTAMPDANYSAVGSASANSAGTRLWGFNMTTNSGGANGFISTGNVRLSTYNVAGSGLIDPVYVFVAIFR